MKKQKQLPPKRKQRTPVSGIWCDKCRKTIPFNMAKEHKHYLGPKLKGEPVVYLDCVICGKKTNHVEIIDGERITVHKKDCAGKLKERELQRIGVAYCIYCKKSTPYKDFRCVVCGNLRLGA